MTDAKAIKPFPIESYNGFGEALLSFLPSIGCMEERTTTVNMDEQGRLYVPKPVRQALGINGEERTVEITVRVENSNSAANTPEQTTNGD